MADGGRCNVCFGSSLVACGCLPALFKGLTTCMATVGGFIRPCVHLACRLGSCSGWTCSIVESMTWTWPSEHKKWWMEANSKWVCFERVRRITSICQAPINQQSTFPCQATVWSWRMGQWFAVLAFTVTGVKVAVIPWSLLLVGGAWFFGPLDCCHQDCRGVRHKSLELCKKTRHQVCLGVIPLPKAVDWMLIHFPYLCRYAP